MKRCMDNFRNMRVREKLIYSHILIALIPFLTVGFVGITISVNEAEHNINQHSEQLIGQVNQMLDVYISSIEKVMDGMIDLIISAEKSGISEDSGDETVDNLKIFMNNLIDNHSLIVGMLFAGADDEYIGIKMNRASRDPFWKEEWYQEACREPDKIHIIGDVTGRNIATDALYSIDDIFSIAKAVTDPKTNEITGVLLFDIRQTMISSSVKDAIIGEEGFVFVLDEENHMVYAPVNEIVYRIQPEWLTEAGYPLLVKIMDKQYHLRFQTSEYTGWKVVSVASYDDVMGEVDKLIIMYGVLLLSTLIFVVFIVMKMSKMITKPILELRNLMKEAEEGKLEVRFRGSYQDEVSELGRSFNHMLEQIQKLMDRVHEEEEYKRQTQLKIVQEQFKPHFLYNTLDTIGWMARAHGAMDVVKMLDALTNIFRIGLSKGKDYISLKEEIKYISNYLYIQNVRYGKKVSYEIEMDESCSQIAVPKMLLQPLVENAIYHGLKLKRCDGHLWVIIKKEADGVSLCVRDDGKGMDFDTSQRIRRVLDGTAESEEKGSFGLYYIRERLELKYGNEYRVYLESQEDVGTEIIIHIPEK